MILIILKQNIVKKLSEDKKGFLDTNTCYALQEEANKKTLFNHRPDQSLGCHTSKLINLEKVTFKKWDGISEVDSCDIFIIGGWNFRYQVC